MARLEEARCRALQGRGAVAVERFLSFAFHYPKPEHKSDLLSAMTEMAAAADGVEGLREMGAFEDPDNDRIVAASVWESMEAFKAAAAATGPVIARTPFDEWERQPREVHGLHEASG